MNTERGRHLQQRLRGCLTGSLRAKPDRLLVLVMLWTLGMAGVLPAAEPPVVTRWHHPEQLQRPLHPAQAFLKTERPSIITRKTFPRAGTTTNRICLLVHSNLYSALEAPIAQWISDAADEGCSTLISQYESGDAESVRAYLASLYLEHESLQGALLIGDIPYAIYEVIQDFDGEGSEVPWYEDFPCDLFYMDIDGVWSDNTTNGTVQPNNGKYDSHTGNTDLEIWVSRLKTSNLTNLGPETAILTNYFAKLHAYRTRTWTVPRRALVYDDDDWSYEGSYDADNVAKCYGDPNGITVINAEETSMPDYRDHRLTNTFELILTRSHGYAGGHSYKTSGSTGTITSAEYINRLPLALFYSFYVCSGADFTASNNLAGTVAFNQDRSGLLCWGSTKTGGMWNDAPLYESIAQGDCVGRSFVIWFNDTLTWGAQYAEAWWYGMVLIGDASLKPAGKDPVLKDIQLTADTTRSTWTSSKGEEYTWETSTSLTDPLWRPVFTQLMTGYTVDMSMIHNSTPVTFLRATRTTPARTNLLHNAGFEIPGQFDRDARYWAWNYPDQNGGIWGYVSRSDALSHDGEWAATVLNATAGTNEMYSGWMQQVPTQPGNAYRFSAWFLAQPGWSATVQDIKLEFYDANTNLLTFFTNGLHTVSNAWVKKEVTGIAPAHSVIVRAAVNVSDAGVSGTLLLDDAELLLTGP